MVPRILEVENNEKWDFYIKSRWGGITRGKIDPEKKFQSFSFKNRICGHIKP